MSNMFKLYKKGGTDMFKLYKKGNLEVMARPVTSNDIANVTKCGDIQVGGLFIAMSYKDKPAKLGDMIAHHPYNDKLQWLISARDFEKFSLCQ